MFNYGMKRTSVARRMLKCVTNPEESHVRMSAANNMDTESKTKDKSEVGSDTKSCPIRRLTECWGQPKHDRVWSPRPFGHQGNDRVAPTSRDCRQARILYPSTPSELIDHRLQGRVSGGESACLARLLSLGLLAAAQRDGHLVCYDS